MRRLTRLGHVLFVLALAIGLTIPAGAVATDAAENPATSVPVESLEAVQPAEQLQASANESNDSVNANDSVNVSVGQQLSTVIAVSGDDVQTDVENTAFHVSVEGMGDEVVAEAIAERAEALRDRADDIRDDYADVTEAYREGEISRSTYGQRLAMLNARAENLHESFAQLSQRAGNISALELQVAGVNQSALDGSIENLSVVRGTGASAILEHFLGSSQGELEIDIEDGLSVEAESEDGDRSREIERDGDDSIEFTVSQAAALDTARSSLSAPPNGSWTLSDADVKVEYGTYRFSFALRGAPNATGEAEVTVDGSSGTVVELEAEIEIESPADSDDESPDVGEDGEGEDGEGDGELALLVTEGDPAPNATVTIRVLADGDPAGNVSVSLNGNVVGRTAADGTVTVTLPASGEAELSARVGDDAGELEFEFEDDSEATLLENLQVDASLSGDTVTVTASYDGSAVSNFTVIANDRRVGTTDGSGTVTFTLDAAAVDELDLELVKGSLEVDQSYDVRDGELVLTEQELDGDDGETETETPDEETDTPEDDTDTPEDETDTPEEDTDTPEADTDTPEDDS